MKKNLIIAFLCLQSIQMIGSEKVINRTSGSRTARTSAPKTSSPMPMKNSNEFLRPNQQAKSPSQSISPGDYLNQLWVSSQAYSPSSQSPREYYSSR